ncbi:TetR/AcrR family transcriptional regulator [Uliginosibacterium sediminicola]|uniref:TetR/AcrR family transcriptional regulator n=1 Tax=Uliginosibacterium sediminicola TaxID=2024550 RepID=A0ABU9Z3F9_9RHOO
MKVSRAEAAQNRERIIDTAAKLFRERGFDGIGVADLMKSAGMTHGGFYGHFASKEDLMAQASMHALEGSLNTLRQVVEHDRENALAIIASTYLSTTHRDQRGEGCAMAALGAEAARHGSPLRAAFTQGVRTTVELITELVTGRTRRAKHQRALTIYASMVGALVLARAVEDEALSAEILESVLASIVPEAD